MMADTASSETGSIFAEQIPDEAIVPKPADEASAAPDADLPKVETDVMVLLAKPFVSNDSNDDQEEAVTDAITEVITRLLVEYFPSTMNRQTKNAIIMIVREVLAWACLEGHMFSTQCTPESKSRSGHTMLPGYPVCTYLPGARSTTTRTTLRLTPSTARFSRRSRRPPCGTR